MIRSALLEIIPSVVGGLGIFMLGMKYMSDGLQATAGDRLRRMIAVVTNNRFLAVGVGTLVTCIVQSSSVTTVMCVGFVNSGFMTLHQAIGVTLGANIGTTITGWILVLEIGKYGLPILGIAALAYRFGKRERLHYLALLAMGVGMVFFGLELMKDGFKPLRKLPEFEQWFHAFQATDYLGVLKCAAVGCILTCIVQSSSATLGITIGLATAGVIPFHTAAALVLGENIGTTITALLASMGASANAKRAAYAHFLFNAIGVFWITLLFGPYLHALEWFYSTMGIDPSLTQLAIGKEVIDAGGLEVVVRDGAEWIERGGEWVRVERIYPHVTKGIALVHSCFNVVNVLVFLPFTSVLARGLRRFVPERRTKEAPHVTRLDAHILETPAIGVEQSRVEILRMGASCVKMMDKLEAVLAEPHGDHADRIRKLFHREEVLDTAQKEIVDFLTELLADHVTHQIVDEGTMQIRMADELESVSDYIGNILKLHLRLHNEGGSIEAKEARTILALHAQAKAYMETLLKAYNDRKPDAMEFARREGDAITQRIRAAREEHLKRIADERVPPLASVTYTNMLNGYRRVKDHMLNFAEAMAGLK